MSFKAAALNEQCLRESQQDAFLLTETPAGVLMAVCDGVGGLEGGDVASAACAKALEKSVRHHKGPIGTILTAGVEAGHRMVRDKAAHADLPGMSTTVVAALVTGNRLRGAWVGDSRLGVLDPAGFRWLSEDHTDEPGSSMLVRAIGMGGELQVAHTMPRTLGPGDVVILCSDGVHGVLEDGELFDILSLHPPAEACRRIRLVLERRGADDNATAVVFQVDHDLDEMPTREIPRLDEIQPPPEPVPETGTTRWLFLALTAVVVVAAAFLLLNRFGA